MSILGIMKDKGEENAIALQGVTFPGSELRRNFFIGGPGKGDLERKVTLIYEPYVLAVHRTVIKAGRATGTFPLYAVHRCNRTQWAMDYATDQLEEIVDSKADCSACRNDIDDISEVQTCLVLPLLVHPFRAVTGRGEEVLGPFVTYLELMPFGYQKTLIEEILFPKILDLKKERGSAIGATFVTRRYREKGSSLGNTWDLVSVINKDKLQAYMKEYHNPEKGRNCIPNKPFEVYPKLSEKDWEKTVEGHCQVCQRHNWARATGMPKGASAPTDLKDVNLDGDFDFGESTLTTVTEETQEKTPAPVPETKVAVSTEVKILDFGAYGLLDVSGNRYDAEGQATGETEVMTDEDKARFDAETGMEFAAAENAPDADLMAPPTSEASAAIDAPTGDTPAPLEGEIIDSKTPKITEVTPDPADEGLKFIEYNNGTREPIVQLEECDGDFVDAEGYLRNPETGDYMIDAEGDEDRYDMSDEMTAAHTARWSKPKATGKKAAKKVSKKKVSKKKKTTSKKASSKKKTSTKDAADPTSAFEPTDDEAEKLNS